MHLSPVGERSQSVEWLPSHVAHQLPGDAGHVTSNQTLFTRPERSPCVGASTHNTVVVFYINYQGSAFAPLVQAGWKSQGKLLAESSSSEYGSRHPVEAGVEGRGMDASP